MNQDSFNFMLLSFILFYLFGLPVANYYVKYDSTIQSSVDSFGKGFIKGILIAGSWITVIMYIITTDDDGKKS